MNRFKPAVKLECFSLPLRQALLAAVKAGAQGVQFDASFELSPSNLSESGRREIRYLLNSHNLKLAAVYCPLRSGLDTLQDHEQRILHVEKVMDLSFELGCGLVALHAGQIPDEKETLRSNALKESLTILGSYGDKTGSTLAFETGLESGKILADYLEKIDSGALGATLDPGNLVLNGFDPLQAILDLGHRIKLVHAREVAGNGPGRAAREVPLGQGNLDWTSLLVYLDNIAYQGYLVCEKEEGNNKAEDVIAGLQFLKTIMGST